MEFQDGTDSALTRAPPIASFRDVQRVCWDECWNGAVWGDPKTESV